MRATSWGIGVRSRMGASYEANSFRSAREHRIAHSRTRLGSFGHNQYGCRGHYGPKLLRRLRVQIPHLASAPEIERTPDSPILFPPGGGKAEAARLRWISGLLRK